MSYNTGPRTNRGPPRDNTERTPLHGGGNASQNYSSTDGSYAGWWRRAREPQNVDDSVHSGLPPYTEAPETESGSRRTARAASRAKEDESDKRAGLGALILVFILGGLIAWVVQDVWALSILSPSATERRRIVWDREYANHQNQVAVMQDITAKWATEIQQHNTERQAMRAERDEMKKERAAWQTAAGERERLEEEGKKLELEKRRRELEREKEEDARKKAGLSWQNPQPGEHCLRYGTRKYTSRLEKIPEGYSRLKACHETQAWINGRWSTPSECDDQGLWGGVLGTWIVDWEEGGCHTFWQDFKDKGCSAEGSGKRRIEAHLENLRPGDDGFKMCASTPAEFHGLTFEGGHTCAYWGIYGHWGIWFIEDGSCR